MLLTAFPAAAFGTNCYVVAPGPGEECLVVDPGIEVLDDLAAVLAEHRLRPAAVLLTHGHLDHVYSVTPVCGGDTAAYVHTDDRYRLHDPLNHVMPGLLEMLEQQFGQRATWREPERVVEVAVRQQDRRRPQPVLGEHVAQGRLDPDARVDDQALLPRARCEHVAVGAEGGGGEGDGEHGVSVASRALPRLGRRCRHDARRPVT